MIRSAYALVALSLWLLPARVAARDANVTPAQAQAAYVQAGFVVESAVQWDWTNPPVTSFRVRDAQFDRRTSAERPYSDRVLLVLVYPDVATARSAQLAAQAREEAELDRHLAFRDDHGPRLVAGYGPSAWTGNVALVQSTDRELTRLQAEQQDRDNGVASSPDDSPPAFRALTTLQDVDADFVGVLLNPGLVSL